MATLLSPTRLEQASSHPMFQEMAHNEMIISLSGHHHLEDTHKNILQKMLDTSQADKDEVMRIQPRGMSGLNVILEQQQILNEEDRLKIKKSIKDEDRAAFNRRFELE